MVCTNAQVTQLIVLMKIEIFRFVAHESVLVLQRIIASKWREYEPGCLWFYKDGTLPPLCTPKLDNLRIVLKIVNRTQYLLVFNLYTEK